RARRARCDPWALADNRPRAHRARAGTGRGADIGPRYSESGSNRLQDARGPVGQAVRGGRRWLDIERAIVATVSPPAGYHLKLAGPQLVLRRYANHLAQRAGFP